MSTSSNSPTPVRSARDLPGEAGQWFQFSSPATRACAAVGGDGRFAGGEDLASLFEADGFVLEPDEAKGYVIATCCRSFPSVMGPDMRGIYGGFHPATLAGQHHRMRHTQLSLEHKMKSYGTHRRDRIMGCVIGTAYPEAPEGGWNLESLTLDDAPEMAVLMTVFKAAEGVPKMLGEHLGGSNPWSVSAEVYCRYAVIGVYDPGDRSIVTLMEALDAHPKGILRDKDNRLLLATGKSGQQLAWAWGGTGEGEIRLPGIAMTGNPGEPVAQVRRMLACGSGEGDDGARAFMVAEPDGGIAIGDEIEWQRYSIHDPASGHVEEILFGGKFNYGAHPWEATEENPVLVVRRADGRTVPQRIGRVKKVEK